MADFIDPDTFKEPTLPEQSSGFVDPDIETKPRRDPKDMGDLERAVLGLPPKKEYSAVETGLMSFAAESPVMGGAAIGAAGGSMISPIIGTIGGAIIGTIAGLVTKYAALKALPSAVDEALGESAKQHPTAAFTGQVASQGIGFGIGAAGKTITQKAISIAMGMGLGGGIEATQEAIEGKELDPKRIAIATAGGGAFSGPVRSVFDKAGKKIVGTVVKDAPLPKFKDPEFEESRIKPEETVQDALQRKKDAEPGAPLARTKKDGTVHLNTAGAIEKDFEAGFPYIFEPTGETGLQKQAVFETLGITKEDFSKQIPDVDTYKVFLKAHEESHVTNKDYDNYPRIKENKDIKLLNFLESFVEQKRKEQPDNLLETYFKGKDRDTDRGVARYIDKYFADLPENVQRDLYSQNVKDLETGEMLNALENGIRGGHIGQLRRLREELSESVGKLDLMHEDAIKREARATLDGLKAANKFYEARAIASSMVASNKENPLTLEASQSLVVKAQNYIRAKTREAEIFGKKLEKAIPNLGIRDRLTRALEGQKKYDVLLTDIEKYQTLYGGQDKVLEDGSKVVDHWVEGKPVFEKEVGLTGALEGMDTLITQGKVAKGFTGTLEEYIAKRDALSFAIEKLKSLPSEEHAIPIMKEVKDRFNTAKEIAKKAGVLDGALENYVTHVLDFSKTKMTPKEQQAFIDKIFGEAKKSKLNRDFTVTRQYQWLRDLEKAVEGTGVVVHTDIAKIVPIYEKSIYAAIAYKEMVDSLSKQLGPDNKAWLLPNSAEAIKEGYVAFQGRNATMFEGLVVHPDLVDTMTHIANIKEPEAILKAMGAVSHLTKALNTVGSLFHAKSLIEAGGLTSPSLMLKEIFTGGSGMRAAADAFRYGGTPAQEKLINGFIENGLMLSTEDIKQTIIAEGGVWTDNLLSKFGPKDKEIYAIRHLTEPFDKHVLQNLNAFTWDYMHAGQKLNVAIQLFSKMKAKNPDIPDEQLMKEVALYANKTFGGLNWLAEATTIQNKYLRAMAVKASGIRGREWAQILFFAPDWTVSTLKAVTNALPKELAKPKNWQFREGIKGIYNPKTSADLSRRYVLNTAIAYLTIINGFNMAMVGRPIWENKDPTRLETPDGTAIQAAKHSMEAAHWAMDPTKTFGNKLGFIPKAVYVEVSGHAYPSIDAPKLKPAYEGYGGMEVSKLGAILSTTLPFQVNAAIQAPKGEAARRAWMSSLGFPEYGMTTEQMATRIKEGRKEAERKRRAMTYEERMEERKRKKGR